MTAKHSKGHKKVQHAKKPAPKPGQGALSEKELDKVAGGITSPRDPQSGLPTGQ